MPVLCVVVSLLFSLSVSAVTIPIGDSPNGIAVDESLNKIYVANYNDGTVYVLDGETQSQSAIVQLNPQYPSVIWTRGVAVNPANSRVYVSGGNGTFYTLDGNSNQVLSTLDLQDRGSWLVYNPDNGTAYMPGYTFTRSGLGQVNLIDVADNQKSGATGAFSLDNFTGFFDVDSGSGDVFFAMGKTGTVVRMPLAQNQVPVPIKVPLGNGTMMPRYNPVTNEVIVANPWNTEMTVIDASQNVVSGSVPGASRASALAIDASDNLIYAASGQFSQLYVVDGYSKAVVKTTGTSGAPGQLAVDSARDRVYVIVGTPDPTVAGGKKYSVEVFEQLFKPLPEITAIQPLQQQLGQNLVISGHRLKASARQVVVTFTGGATAVAQPAGTSAEGQDGSDAVTVTVPEGALSGPLSVAVDGVASALSDESLTITTPVIQSFTPAGVVPGNSLWIHGENFNSEAGQNTVIFNGGARAVPESGSSSLLKVVVPENAKFGTFSVVNEAFGEAGASPGELRVMQVQASLLQTPVSFNLDSVARGNSQYLAVGTNGTVVSSADGTHWAHINPQPKIAYGMHSLQFVNGQFMAFSPEIGGGGGGRTYTSKDGRSWGDHHLAQGVYSVQYMGGEFFATVRAQGGRGSAFAVSRRGYHWDTVAQIPPGISQSPAGNFYDFAYGNGVYVAVGTGIYNSVNGQSWNYMAQSSVGPRGLNAVSWSPELNLFVALCDNGNILSSPQGKQWTPVSSPGSNQRWPQSVVWSQTQRMFLAVGRFGVVLYSWDGVHWNEFKTEGADMHDVIATDFGFLAVGADGKVLNIQVNPL